jgi:RNA polymerase sigma factor (sigma-70 family)
LVVNEIKPIVEPVGVAGRDLARMPLAATIAAAYDAHSAAIFGLTLRATRDRDLAADITQEAFLRLLTEGQAGRLPDNVGGWLYRTSANLVISRARRVAVARRLAPRLVPRDEPDGPEAIALGNERHRELDASLATLSVADRVALVMAAQGATGEEIAGHLGRTHAATRTHLTRARARLRAAMVPREASR